MLALVLSFVASVFVFPSLLYLWSRRASVGAAAGVPANAVQSD